MIKKRSRAYEDDPSNKKKFQSNTIDIWRSLDKIRRSFKDAEIPIKRSFVFIPCCPESNEVIQECITKLLQYVDAEKLVVSRIKNGLYTHIISLKSFSALDFCLVVPVVLSALRRSKANNIDFFQFQTTTMSRGNIFFPMNCLLGLKTDISHVRQVSFPEIMGFQQYHCERTNGNNNNISDLVNDLFLLISNLKFGKNSACVIDEFKTAVSLASKRLSLGITEINMMEQGFLLNKEDIVNRNLKHINESKNKLQEFAQSLLNPKEEVKKEVKEEMKPITTKSRFSNRNQPPQQTFTRFNTKDTREATKPSSSSKPHFMTNEEIIQNCILTIRASIDSVKKMSAYQIVKVYIRYPKKVIEPLFKNINDLRNKTNCNIIILHYNNEHESTEWFKSLETKSLQVPNPQTVRIVSVGGVAEYIANALEEMLALLEKST